MKGNPDGDSGLFGRCADLPRIVTGEARKIVSIVGDRAHGMLFAV